jgi:hypothetical protein
MSICKDVENLKMATESKMKAKTNSYDICKEDLCIGIKANLLLFI